MYELRIFEQKGANKPKIYQDEKLSELLIIQYTSLAKFYTITKIETQYLTKHVTLIDCK